MKLRTSIFVLTLTASAALAQSGLAPIDAAHRAAKASSAKTEQSNQAVNEQLKAPAAPAASAMKATPFLPKAPVKAAAAPAATAPAAPAAAKPNPAPEMVKKVPANARDPFVSIIRTDKTAGQPCVSGKKCLMIGDIILRGIVRSQNAVVAVVENPEKKTYFLHENDPVFEGEVVKITSDAIVFREQVIDRAGRKSTREVTKHLNARPIA